MLIVAISVKILSKDNSHLSLLDNCSGAIIFSCNSFLFAILNIIRAYSYRLIQWPIHRININKCKTINWQVKLGRKAFLANQLLLLLILSLPSHTVEAYYQKQIQGYYLNNLPQKTTPALQHNSVWKTELLHLLRICFPSVFIWSFFSSFLLDITYFTFHYQAFFKVCFLEQKIWLTGKAVSSPPLPPFS